VPVGYAVARALNVPLDVLVVRKLGVPGHEELAMGAIASGMVRVLNRDVLAHVPNPAATLEDVTAREDREMGRRERQYRDSRIAQDLEHKIVILTDDGLATGRDHAWSRNVAKTAQNCPMRRRRTCRTSGHMR
jgi:putative phosphoribosyl transferase